jgi:hypothetical protein
MDCRLYTGIMQMVCHPLRGNQAESIDRNGYLPPCGAIRLCGKSDRNNPIS